MEEASWGYVYILLLAYVDLPFSFFLTVDSLNIFVIGLDFLDFCLFADDWEASDFINKLLWLVKGDEIDFPPSLTDLAFLAVDLFLFFPTEPPLLFLSCALDFDFVDGFWVLATLASYFFMSAYSREALLDLMAYPTLEPYYIFFSPKAETFDLSYLLFLFFLLFVDYYSTLISYLLYFWLRGERGW